MLSSSSSFYEDLKSIIGTNKDLSVAEIQFIRKRINGWKNAEIKENLPTETELQELSELIANNFAADHAQPRLKFLIGRMQLYSKDPAITDALKKSLTDALNLKDVSPPSKPSAPQPPQPTAHANSVAPGEVPAANAAPGPTQTGKKPFKKPVLINKRKPKTNPSFDHLAVILERPSTYEALYRGTQKNFAQKIFSKDRIKTLNTLEKIRIGMRTDVNRHTAQKAETLYTALAQAKKELASEFRWTGRLGKSRLESIVDDDMASIRKQFPDLTQRIDQKMGIQSSVQTVKPKKPS